MNSFLHVKYGVGYPGTQTFIKFPPNLVNIVKKKIFGWKKMDLQPKHRSIGFLLWHLNQAFPCTAIIPPSQVLEEARPPVRIGEHELIRGQLSPTLG